MRNRAFPTLCGKNYSSGFGLLVAACILSSDARAAVTGSIKQLSTAGPGSTQTSPMISGTKVVWSGSSPLASGGSDYDIFLLPDLAGSAPRNISNSPDELEFLGGVDVDNVAWVRQGGQPGSSDIVLYDTNQSYTTTIAANDHFDQVAIRGRYIVYVHTGAQVDIAGYDLALGLPLPDITNDAATQRQPRLSTDYVVYEDYARGNADIFGYKLSTQGPPFAIATGAVSQTSPDIDGDYVVWLERGSDYDQIVSYNLSTHVVATVSATPSRKRQPRVSGTRVVWSDDRNGTLDLYTSELTTGVEELLVGGAGDQMMGDIDGNRVVYTSNDTGFEQVYLYTITGLVPEGCDPTKTDVVGAPVDLVKPSAKPVYVSNIYNVVDGKSYWVCVENGSNGGARTSTVVLTNDGKTILTPTDFGPASNPPQWVAGRLFADDFGQHGGPNVSHSWSASSLGVKISSVTITLRVGK